MTNFSGRTTATALCINAFSGILNIKGPGPVRGFVCILSFSSCAGRAGDENGGGPLATFLYPELRIEWFV